MTEQMSREERSKIFEHIIVDLDYVASMDEEEHGENIHSKRIREVLIPFCEQEGGLKSDPEEWTEHVARQNQ